MSKSMYFSIVVTAVFVAGFATLGVKGQVAALYEKSYSQRNEEVTRLMAVIRNQSYRENQPELVVKAIDRLAEMKANEAVPALIEIITFKVQPISEVRIGNFGIEYHAITDFDRYPVINALFQLGKSAFPELINVIENEECESLPNVLAFEVIETVLLREELDQSIVFFQKKSARSLNPQIIECYEIAAERMRKAVDRVKSVIQ